jgi:hypothetical protein
MKDHLQEVVEIKKPWTAPELKKIDIEEVTGAGTGSGDDGFTGSDS